MAGTFDGGPQRRSTCVANTCTQQPCAMPEAMAAWTGSKERMSAQAALAGGWFKRCVHYNSLRLGLENLGENVEPSYVRMSAFTSTPSERTMDEHSSKWRDLVGLANCPRGPRGLPIA
eukprot:scaffold7772_cov141-Isochrysis_galbana.AAC.3